MTITQISTIIYLLLAFGVSQPTVDTVHSILLKSNTQGLPVGSAYIPNPTTQDVPRETSISVTVNGLKQASLTPDGCIVTGVKTCATGAVEWHFEGSEACGITFLPQIGWAGNFGQSGTKQAQFGLGTTTVTLECGNTTDTAQVYVK